MAKFHLIPIVLGAAIGVGAYVVSKYLAQNEESEHIVDDAAFDDSEDTAAAEDTAESESTADTAADAEDAAAEDTAADTEDAGETAAEAEPAPEEPEAAAEAEPVPEEPEAAAEEEKSAEEEPAAPAEEPKAEDAGVTIPISGGSDVPNANPVRDKTEPAKLTEDGKVDPTTIAKAEDFGDWEEETGCRG